jgi:hypothetical protein
MPSRPSRLEDDVPAAPDDDLSAGFLCERDDRDMILEIDVHEEGALLVGEVALHDEEATLQRLGAGLSIAASMSASSSRRSARMSIWPPSRRSSRAV